jgi:hypothetical protein
VTAGALSPDGLWRWDGQGWRPTWEGRKANRAAIKAAGERLDLMTRYRVARAVRRGQPVIDPSLRPLTTAYIRRLVRNAEKTRDITRSVIVMWGLTGAAWSMVLVDDLVTGRSVFLAVEFSVDSLLFVVSFLFVQPRRRRRLIASAAALAAAA